MGITREDVKKIAHLARIELSEEEQREFEKDLSSILDFIGKLNELNTADVIPVTGGTTKETVFREDTQIDVTLEGNAAMLIADAPETERGFIKVKKVF